MALSEPVSPLRFGCFALDLRRGCLLVGEAEEVPLRPKTFEFLRYLVINRGRLLSKDELFDAVWPNVAVTDDSIVQCVKELRRALRDDDQQVIKTVQRRGYRFDPPRADVSTAALPPSKPQVATPQDDGFDRRSSSAAARRVNLILATLGVAMLIVAAVISRWSPESPHTSPGRPPLSIVVLPFSNLSDDPAQGYFAQGVSNDLTTELSRLPGTFVIANATARTFRQKSYDIREVGRELNVRYVLDGSVRRTGDQVHINVQLIDAETAATVWAERFQRQRDQLPAWHDEIIGRIANTLNYRLTRLESERGLRDHRVSPEAQDLAMRGWAQVYAAKRPENYHAARALFRRAIERDPQAVNALAGIGWTSAVMVLDGWSRDRSADIAEAENAIKKVFSINPNHVVAHHVRGFLYRLQRRSNAARDTFRTVIALNSNFAPAYAQLGVTELELGHPEAAIAAVEQAMRLSPRDPSLGPWLAFIGMAEMHRGRYGEAVSWLTRAVNTGTPVARHHAYLVSALALAGRISEARTALDDFRALRPSATVANLRTQAKSTDAGFVAQQEHLFEGLRIAGLPE